MEETALYFTKHACCKSKRKKFTILIIGFLISFLTFNIFCKSSFLVDSRMTSNTSNYAYNDRVNIMTNTSIQRALYLRSSIPVTTHGNQNVRTLPVTINNSRHGRTSPVFANHNSHVTIVSVSPYVNQHDFKYLILERSVCHSKNGSVFLVVVVCSAPANFRERMTIRETWGSIVKTNNDIRLIFMLGKTLNVHIQKQINNESTIHHDIVQEDFLDSYRNLSIKSAAMLKWSFTYCPSAQYVLKSDDDMFVNLEFLTKLLKRKLITNAVIGEHVFHAKPIRDNTSKWYTPRKLFPGSVYPTYASGTAYLLSGDIIEKLYNITLVTPLFWLEDIYITGICRSKAKIRILGDSRFTMETLRGNGCLFRQRFTGHQYTEREIRKMWTEFTDKSLKC